MPRQNRVTPAGEIVAVPDRGTLMGNRGVLHDADGRIRRSWHLKRWIICVLAFRGRRRQVMTPGRYTELFFLDEATALAAGHRPCAECQRGRYDAFRQAWRAAQGSSLPTAGAIDERLHAERLAPGEASADVADLPEGVFVRVESEVCLSWKGELLVWSAGGYSARRARRGVVRLLTPGAIVETMRQGYVPGVHATAE